MKTLKIIVLGVIVYWLAFVGLSWYAYFTTGAVPDTLVQYGLGCSSVELIATAAIEISKHMINKKYPETEAAPDEEDDADGVTVEDMEGDIYG